jgi:hypothetical protein
LAEWTARTLHQGSVTLASPQNLSSLVSQRTILLESGEELTFRSYDGVGRIQLTDSTYLAAIDTVTLPSREGHGQRVIFQAPGKVQTWESF